MNQRILNAFGKKIKPKISDSKNDKLIDHGEQMLIEFKNKYYEYYQKLNKDKGMLLT